MEDYESKIANLNADIISTKLVIKYLYFPFTMLCCFCILGLNFFVAEFTPIIYVFIVGGLMNGSVCVIYALELKDLKIRINYLKKIQELDADLAEARSRN